MNVPIRHGDIKPAAAKPTLPAFVHLRVRSAYSLLQGALPIAELAKLAVANLRGHSARVFSVRWSPTNPNIVFSGGKRPFTK